MAPDETASERLSAGVWEVDPRFRTAVEALQDGLVVYSSIRDDQGEIVDFKCEYANKASAENRGVQPEEQVGRRLLDVFPGVRRDGLLDRYIDVVETGVPLVLDVPWYEDETTHGAFEIRAARLDDGFVLAFRDVTERRDEERKIAHLAAAAAHDLKAPLRAIAGFADVLRREYADRLDADANEWIGHIVDSAEHMSVLIDDMLTFARAGGPDHHPVPLELAEIAAEVHDALAPTLKQVGAVIEIAELPRVEADAAEISRALRNLLTNALKFARPGEAPRVVVDAEHAGGRWAIRVTDNGVGVPEAEREKIFEPFHRGSTAAGKPGSGLGLAVCDRIAKRHGGEMWVEPTPGGVGSRFCITLPEPPGGSADDSS